MGSHSVKDGREKGGEAKSKVGKRYGHWHAKLEGKPELSAAMHEEGKRGLQMVRCLCYVIYFTFKLRGFEFKFRIQS